MTLKAKESPVNGLAVLAEKLAARVGASREVLELSGTLLPRLLRRWAGDTSWKRMVARPVARTINKAATCPANIGSAEPLSSVLSDKELVRLLAQNTPVILNAAAEAMSGFFSAVDDLPAGEREQLVGTVLGGLNYASVGEMLTTCARMVNEVHETNPTFLSDRLIPALVAMIEKTDFGELDDFYFKSTADIAALAGALTDTLMKHPAKMVCLMGLGPGIVNLIVAVAGQSLGKANTLAADILTEILLSLTNDIDGKAVGELLNQLFEVVRKIHTGSALLGPPGRPELTTLLIKKFGQIGSSIDPNLLWKTRMAFTELMEARLTARIELLRENPELFSQRLREKPSLGNAHIRTMRKSAELADEFDDEFLSGAVEEGFRQIDAKSLADTINVYCRIANRVRETRPKFLTDLLHQFTNAADHSEIAQTVKWLMADMEKAAKPFGRAVTSEVIVGFCRMCRPCEDDYNDDMQSALSALSDLIHGAKEA